MTEAGSGTPGPDERYDPSQQDRSVIAMPLLEQMAMAERSGSANDAIPLVIDVNLDYPAGRLVASSVVRQLVDAVLAGTGEQESAAAGSTRVAEAEASGQYLLTRLTPAQIRELAQRNRELAYGNREVVRRERPGEPPIHQIWPDFEVRALLDHSLSTVKADALHAAFGGFGKDICWAVLDTGIDAHHPHFAKFKNVLDAPVPHRDFTDPSADPCVDANGHGSHVAGIIAGYNAAPEGAELAAVRYERDEKGNRIDTSYKLELITGIAPQCRLVSYKVLDDNGIGRTGDILSALDAIQQVNDYGRRLRIHGVNLSLGYDFDPKWFACGQSPLCVAVDRLVRSGVVVVVAAGNSGYAYAIDASTQQAVAAGRMLSINDPGNSALAITVGSTHRDMPHTYGVSYFSSKGPTGDGRAKPDLVAPGERILSAAAGARRGTMTSNGTRIDYVEDSGTSMAAPHVSGVIAAFLSIRNEYIGQPEQVKRIFTSTATDLGRVRDFQGAGLIDAMRAIQSV